MPWRVARVFVARVFVALCLVGVAAGAADRPPIDHWVAMLSDPDPSARAEARERLMGLTAADLPSLHAAVTVRLLLTSPPSASPPKMPPALEGPVRDVVTYVLTRAAVQRLTSQGESMLGIQLGVSTDDLQGFVANDNRSTSGVPVAARLPGFAAYRYLRAGDLIVGFVVDDTLHRVFARKDVQAFVLQRRAGETVTLRVQRVDRLLTIDIPLDRRPRDTPRRPGPMNEAEEAQTGIELNRRLADAAEQSDAAFARTFGSLLSDGDDRPEGGD